MRKRIAIGTGVAIVIAAAGAVEAVSDSSKPSTEELENLIQDMEDGKVLVDVIDEHGNVIKHDHELELIPPHPSELLQQGNGPPPGVTFETE